MFDVWFQVLSFLFINEICFPDPSFPHFPFSGDGLLTLPASVLFSRFCCQLFQLMTPEEHMQTGFVKGILKKIVVFYFFQNAGGNPSQRTCMCYDRVSA